MSVKNGRVPPEKSVERDGREDAQKRARERAILMAARNATARIRTSRHVAEMNKVFKTMSDPRLSDQRLYGGGYNLDEWAMEHTKNYLVANPMGTTYHQQWDSHPDDSVSVGTSIGICMVSEHDDTLVKAMQAARCIGGC